MERQVTTTGTGTAHAPPDAAVVRVSAVHRAANVSEALSGSSSAATAIGEVARRFTTANRIASRELNVWPAHDNNGNQVGHEASHALEIGCPDLTSAGALLDALAAEVGDRLQVGGITPKVSDPGPALVAAREAAYADALARAQHLAGLAGAELGTVLSVAEGQGSPGRFGGIEVASYDSRAKVGFEPGESGITTSVTVTWQLV